MPYVVLPFVDRMDLAYAAADLVVCRAGASSLTEAAASGLPAVFVPLPIGNGEQVRNARPVVEAGGGLLVADADLTPAWVADHVPAPGHGPRAARGDGRGGGRADPARRRRAARPHRPRRRPCRAGRAGPAMRVPVPEEILPAERLGRVHFVGIGGAGLSGIARIMLARGIPVSGSDGTDSPALEALRALGARVHLGHDAAHVHDVDTLVVSTAVREDNPEYVEARRQGLRVLPRSAALASVMAGRRVLAVAGTHGKTTTTSLLTVALQAAGADPTYAIGGDLAQTGVNAAEGGGEVFVAEADESDGAFLVYRPHAAVVTNVEADHLDNWGTEEAYRAAFVEFAGHVDPGGRRLPGLRASTTTAPRTSPGSPGSGAWR